MAEQAGSYPLFEVLQSVIEFQQHLVLTLVDTLLAHADSLSDFGFAVVMAVHIHNGAVELLELIQCRVELVNN